MGYTEDFISLQGIKLTLNSGLVVDITELNIEYTIEFKERRIGNGFIDRVIVARDAKISAKGWNGTDLGFKDLIPGSGFSALTVKEGNVSFLQGDFFTNFPLAGWTMGDVSTALRCDSPSDWDIAVVPRVLNNTQPEVEEDEEG